MIRRILAVAVCVLFVTSLVSCKSFQTETHKQDVVIETYPPGANVWYQDKTGQHSLGKSPVTLTREYQAQVYQANYGNWLMALGFGGATGVCAYQADSSDSSTAGLGIAGTVVFGIFAFSSLLVAISGQLMDGDVIKQVGGEIQLGAQLDGYTGTPLTFAIPNEQSNISLLLHPVGMPEGGPGDLTLVVLHSADFERVFPSQIHRYNKSGVGKIELENRTTLPMQVDLELSIDGWAEPAHTILDLPPGETGWHPVKATFTERALSNTGQRTLQAIVRAHYVHDDVKRTTRKSFPVVVLEGNAFSWEQTERIGSFINANDPPVEKYSSELYRQFAKLHPQEARAAHPLRNHLLALFAWQSLAQSGLRYKPDSNRPFTSLEKGALDTVMFPSQTLDRKVGDCDDLVVLYGSVLESMNVPTAVVPVEGHVFLMYDTGVREENRAAFPVDRHKTVVRAGNLWVPVETTLLGKAKRFEEAWIMGAENYHNRFRPEPKTVVETRTAWSDNPPAALPSTKAKTPATPVDLASADSQRLLAAYTKRVSRLAGSGKDTASLLKRGAALLKSGMFDQAERAYTKASSKRKSFASSYGLAAAQAGQGNMLKALVSFQEALKKASDNRTRFASQLAIAQCYKVDGNLKKARKHLEKALELNPAARNDSRYRGLIAYLNQEAGTKAFGESETPVYFQEIINGL